MSFVFADAPSLMGVVAGAEALATTTVTGGSALAGASGGVIPPALDAEISPLAVGFIEAHTSSLLAALTNSGLVQTLHSASTAAASATYEVTDLASEIGIGSILA